MKLHYLRNLIGAEGCKGRGRGSKTSRYRSRRSRIRRSKDQVRSPNQEVQDQRGQDLSWKINRWENLIVFSIAFSLSIYKRDLHFNLEKVINLLISPLCDCSLFKIFISSSREVIYTLFRYQSQLITLSIMWQIIWLLTHPSILSISSLVGH